MRTATLVVFAFSCHAQVELVNNQWPTDPQGNKFFPDSKVSYVSRITRGDGTGISGLTYHYTVQQYKRNGFHTHELDSNTRPTPAFIPSSALPSGGENGSTDAQGYAVANIELNGFSGWYTVCATVVGAGTKCVNNNTRYWTSISGYPIYLERYSGGLQPYTANAVNQPQTLHADNRHVASAPPESAGNFDGYTTRWVTHDTHLRLIGMSGAYKSDTTAQTVPDMLDLTRASLPDGGIYDNDVSGIAPGSGNSTLEWDTRVFEEHARGTEADIVIPFGTLNQNIFFAAATTYGCYLGKYKPTSELIYTGSGLSEQTQIENYWKSQGIAHVSCKPGQSLRGGYHPGFPAK